MGGTFLYNVGPITALDSPNWNRRQFYSVTRIDWTPQNEGQGRWRHHNSRRHGQAFTQLASNLPCPPCNVGPRSTPNYAALANTAIQTLPDGSKVFAGQRAEGFYVDLGSIFDLGALRPDPAAPPHRMPGSAMAVNATKDLNVHSIALQVPMTLLTADGNPPTDPKNALSVIGVWTTASRQHVHFNYESRDDWSNPANVGPWTQVSRLGNPLFNEVLVPMEKKDDWNSDSPFDDSQYADGVLHPELAKLLPVLYPDAFPNLAALVASGKPRADLAAILLTGIPAGVVSPNFQNFTGTDASRPAAPEHGDPAFEHAEQPRCGGRRPRRLPERTPYGRRRGEHRAEGDRGRDLPAHRPDLHARRRGRGGRSRAHEQRDRPDREGYGELPACVPVPGSPAQRLRGAAA